LGAFTLGMLFPFANNFGALVGILFSIVTTGFLGISNIIAGKQGNHFNQKAFLTTQGCNDSSLTLSTILENSNFTMSWKTEPSTFSNDVFNMSYTWQPVFGCLLTIIVGGVVSGMKIVFCPQVKIEKVHKSLLNKPFLRFWTAIIGQSRLTRWVEYGPSPYKK